METLMWAFLGGMVGAVLMDITETYAAKWGITSGVNVALIGRWFLGMLQGRFTYTNILNATPLALEVKAGWALHFLVGGGGVALGYPIFFQLTGLPLPLNHILSGLLFGLLTSLLPWLMLLPAFGWGFFGRRGPTGSNAFLASTLSHIPYGFGVGAVMALGARV